MRFSAIGFNFNFYGALGAGVRVMKVDSGD
jgi:hypothetical protein